MGKVKSFGSYTRGTFCWSFSNQILAWCLGHKKINLDMRFSPQAIVKNPSEEGVQHSKGVALNECEVITRVDVYGHERCVRFLL